jgi:hypothetical protein
MVPPLVVVSSLVEVVNHADDLVLMTCIEGDAVLRH